MYSIFDYAKLRAWFCNFVWGFIYMLVSNVSFASSVYRNTNNMSYNCSGCGKRKDNDLNSADTYIKNVETDNQNLKKALRFACKIIATNEG